MRKGKTIKNWQWVIIAVSFALMFCGNYLPPVLDLGSEAMHALGIFAGTLLLMILVDTTWPPLLAIVAVASSGIMTMNDALAASFGNSVTLFVLFATMLAYGIRKSGFLERVSYWVVSRPLSRKHPWIYMSLLLAAPLVVGFVTDLMTNLIVFYSIYSRVLETAGYKKGDKMPRLFMMLLILIDGMSCGATPISHVGTVVGIGLYEASTGATVNIAVYCFWGITFSVVFLVILILLLRFVFRMDVSGMVNVDVKKIEVAEHIRGPITRREICNVVVFGIAVILWIVPGVLQYSVPVLYAYTSRLGTVGPAFIGVVLLALVHSDKEPLVDTVDAITNGTAWGAVLLTSGVMLFVRLLGISELGIITSFSKKLAVMTGGMTGIVYVLFAVFLVVLISNFCSNTVSNTVVYTLMVPVVLSGGIAGVNALVLTCVITYGCEIAISTPAASAYAGMMNSFGWFSGGYQLGVGLLLSAISILVIALAGYPMGVILM